MCVCVCVCVCSVCVCVCVCVCVQVYGLQVSMFIIFVTHRQSPVCYVQRMCLWPYSEEICETILAKEKERCINRVTTSRSTWPSVPSLSIEQANCYSTLDYKTTVSYVRKVLVVLPLQRNLEPRAYNRPFSCRRGGISDLAKCAKFRLRNFQR